MRTIWLIAATTTITMIGVGSALLGPIHGWNHDLGLGLIIFGMLNVGLLAGRMPR